MFGAPGSGGVASDVVVSGGAVTGPATRRGAPARRAAPVVRARTGAAGSRCVSVGSGLATRLTWRLGATRRSGGGITWTAGSGVAPGVVGTAFGIPEGRLPESEGCADGAGGVGGELSVGLEGVAASGGFPFCGLTTTGCEGVADIISPMTSVECKRDMFSTKI